MRRASLTSGDSERERNCDRIPHSRALWCSKVPLHGFPLRPLLPPLVVLRSLCHQTRCRYDSMDSDDESTGPRRSIGQQSFFTPTKGAGAGAGESP